VFQPDEGIFRDSSGITYVPASLRPQVFAWAHGVLSAHRAADTTLKIITSTFSWPGVAAYVSIECARCLACLRRQPAVVPRPYGDLLYGTTIGEVWFLDACSMPAASTGERNYLLAREGITGYLRTEAVADLTAPTAARFLKSTMAALSIIPRTVVVDAGSTFKGDFARLSNQIGYDIHVVTPAVHQANGPAERSIRTITETLVSTLAARNDRPEHWVDHLWWATLAYNCSPSQRLGSRSPAACFLGRPVMSLVDVVNLFSSLPGSGSPPSLESIIEAVAKQHESFAEQERLLIERTASARAERHRQRAAARHVHAPDFEPGDLVLVSRSTFSADPPGTSKLSPNWLGPAVVISECHGFRYKVRFLGTTSDRDVHVQHLKLFHRGPVDDDEALLRASDASLVGKFIVEKLADIKKSGNSYSMLVHWLGYTGSDATSWQPLMRLYQDVPTMVRDFVQSFPFPGQRAAWRQDVLRRLDDADRRRAKTEERQASAHRTYRS
jgi:hypothetical protein